ncbi:MAG: peptidoglycan editing factor PgeF [Gammaproteobacteria bacterium]
MSPAGPRFIRPDWPAPARVQAVSTTREGGVSPPPYAGFNLATHVGDRSEHVADNRRQLRQTLGLASEPCWLQQVHSNRVVVAQPTAAPVEADASVTRQSGPVCVVMTADCLPVLFCDRAGSVVAAAHAGWRGLADGILEQTLAAMQVPATEVMAWLGPAIGPTAYEVGVEVRDTFVSASPAAAPAFVASRAGHWWMDLYQLARQRLQAAGLSQFYGGDHCTHTERERFYSYRRDGVTGRMASLIWLTR